MKHYYYFNLTVTTFYSKYKKEVFNYFSSEGILIARSYGDAMDYLLDNYTHAPEREVRTVEINEWTETQATKTNLKVFNVISWNKYRESIEQNKQL